MKFARTLTSLGVFFAATSSVVGDVVAPIWTKHETVTLVVEDSAAFSDFEFFRCDRRRGGFNPTSTGPRSSWYYSYDRLVVPTDGPLRITAKRGEAFSLLAVPKAIAKDRQPEEIVKELRSHQIQAAEIHLDNLFEWNAEAAGKDFVAYYRAERASDGSLTFRRGLISTSTDVGTDSGRWRWITAGFAAAIGVFGLGWWFSRRGRTRARSANDKLPPE